MCPVHGAFFHEKPQTSPGESGELGASLWKQGPAHHSVFNSIVQQWDGAKYTRVRLMWHWESPSFGVHTTVPLSQQCELWVVPHHIGSSFCAGSTQEGTSRLGESVQPEGVLSVLREFPTQCISKIEMENT